MAVKTRYTGAMLPEQELQRPVLDYSSKDFPTLDENLTTGEAINCLRERGLRDKIIYFYVTDSEGRLSGVLPTRRLLTDPADTPVTAAMIRRVVAIPTRASLLEACEFFVLHKFLAFPVIDEHRRIVGVLDVSVFTEEVLDLAEREQMNDIFQSLGFRVSEVRSASAGRAFLLRFPWLLATIAGGTVCALLSGAYATTLQQRIVLAFFMTMVLGLGDSVSAQSVAVTLQAMHRQKPTFGWLCRSLGKEMFTAGLLGLTCALLVSGIVVVSKHDPPAAFSIGLSIFLSILIACALGMIIPAGARALKLDPRIAAGPLSLALTDICTLVCYFALAKWLLTNL